MARMIPNLEPDALAEVTSSAERTTYTALRQSLPNNVVVIHSLCLVSQRPGDGACDSESDFLIVHPDFGLLTIEVKGGGIELDASRGQWYSTDRTGVRHEISDPFRQATRGKHAVLQFVRNSAEWGRVGPPRILSGHAALFPDLVDLSPLVGADRPSAILGGRDQIQHLRQWIQSVFEFWAGEDRRWAPLQDAGVRIIERSLCRSVMATPPLAHAIARDQQRQFELTERQAHILRALRLRTRAAIAGGAGTGKSVLALRHATDLAQQGLETLLVCYNRLLADNLAAQARSVANLTAMNFHQLCHRRVDVIRRTYQVDLMEQARAAYPRENEFDVQLPFALGLSVEHDPFRYDAIVVDEGQDFSDEFWLPIELLLKEAPSSRLYVFYDTNQSVYRVSAQIPITEPPLLLTENCRNTRAIHEVAYRYYMGETVYPPEIDGATPEALQRDSIDEQARGIRDLINRLITSEQLQPSDITLLVLGEPKESYYRKLEQHMLGNGVTWCIEGQVSSHQLRVDTVRRFKGLESPVVVLWCSESVDSEVDRELIYVGLSRARSRLFLVGDRVRLSGLIT